MAAGKNKRSKIGGKNSKIPVAPVPPQPSGRAGGQHMPLSPVRELHLKLSAHLLIAAAIAIITWLCLEPCLSNTITTWDDTAYLRDDLFIKDITWHGIRNIFTNPVMGNYHPLTVLSFAVEYNLVQLEPWLYHFDSLLLHIMATLLVYWFIMLLTRKPVAAVITSLLFALHPMHIESVAWVSGRKDLLCGLFYMAACVAYLFYLRAAKGHKPGWYLLVIALFIFALLSKGIAVTLPLTLLLIDYFETRSVNKNDMVSKIPHFLLALLFGIISVKVQHAAGAMDMQKVVYNPVERIALGSYALTTYLWKAVIPAGQHCLYPYPPKVNGALPLYYYLYPASMAALIFLAWKYGRRNPVIVFGSLFFIANIALLLQFIPVGESIVAERYTYLPYIGLFFMAGWWVSGFVEQGQYVSFRYLPPAVVAVYIIFLGYRANERCRVWYDELSLWTDEVAKEPVLAPQAWNNLGYRYTLRWSAATDPEEKKTCFDSAIYLLNRAIAVKPDFLNPYIAMGDLQRNAGMSNAAKATFFKAFKMKPTESNLALELAITYYVDKDMDSAGIFFRKELQLDSTSPAHGNYGNYLEAINKNDSALLEYNKAIALSNTNFILFANRGKLFKKLNRWNEASKDFETAIKMNPDAAELYYLRSFCDTQQHNKPKALQDIEKSISLGYTGVDKDYYEGLKK